MSFCLRNRRVFTFALTNRTKIAMKSQLVVNGPLDISDQVVKEPSGILGQLMTDMRNTHNIEILRLQ